MTNRFTTSRCRGCGKPIVWGVDANGTRIPLDPKPPVYRVQPGIGGGYTATREPDVLVSHFATCPDADRFSGKGRAGG